MSTIDQTVSETSPGPARPEKLTVEFYEEPDGVAVHKKRGGGPAGFAILWLVGWTVGCVFLAAQFIKDPTWTNALFATGFWVAWLAVAAFAVWGLFGKETLLVREDAALFQRTALVNLSSRLIPRSEIQGFRECRSVHQENDEYLWGIEMVTLGKPVRFAFRLPDQERAWLIHQLNQYPKVTGPSASLPMLEQSAAPLSIALRDEQPLTPAVVQTLDYEQTLSEPPQDNRWQLEDEAIAFTFSQRGRLSVVALLGGLFICLFWNSIVGMFVLTLLGLGGNAMPQGGMWWGMFVFLIPFEVIGLLFFVALLRVMLEPFRQTVWRFESHRIERQVRWPIYSHVRGWDVQGLDRLELRLPRAGDTRPSNVSELATGGFARSKFQLLFIASDNTELCQVTGLTEGEARWLAREIFDRRANWFGPKLVK